MNTNEPATTDWIAIAVGVIVLAWMLLTKGFPFP